MRAVAKHSPQLAQSVVDCGALDSLVICLEEFDPTVKEAAAWALGYIARHSEELAQAVVDAGAVPLLVLCIQEPEIALKRIAASTISDIAKHSPELAQTVVDAGAIAHLAQMILNPDSKLKVNKFYFLVFDPQLGLLKKCLLAAYLCLKLSSFFSIDLSIILN